jgi:glutaredoxin/DNA-directed RNA polymerase subunit RPC12/RpoP
MENSFADQFPEIAKQWHPTLNGTKKPSEFSVGSSMSVHWICPKNPEHIWKTRINSRAKGRGCPYCAGKRKLGYKYRTLAETYPDIAAEWHPTKNNISPEKVSEASSKKFWWKCKNNPDHEWIATVNSRTANNVPCPYCSGRILTKENSFGGKYPELAKQWHPSKNGSLTPYSVFQSHSKSIWWQCPDHPEHEWKALIRTRLQGSGKCPICIQNSPVKLPSLSLYNPELLKEWHYEKNGELSPDQISAGSDKIVWWKCQNNPAHEWQTEIKNRTTKKRGCPYCKGQKAGNRSITALYPNLALEWHPTKNPISPDKVTPGSRRRIWWQCLVNPEHEWQSFVFARTKGEGTCPYCAQTGKSFAEKYPLVAEEWHPTKNGDVKVSEVPYSSQKKYWWMCKNNPEHEWEATPQNRGFNQSGCPHCHKEKQGQALSDYLASSAASNTEYFQTFIEGIKNIQRLIKLEPSHHEQRQILNRLLYANIVTLMETFLSDAFVNIVLNNQAYTRKLVETTPKFIDGKFSKSNIFALMENLEKEVTEYLLNEVTYHNIWIVEKMYRSVLNIRFQFDLVSIDKIVRCRHDIVHRNGKTVDGKPVVISSEDVKNAIEIIRDFVSGVEKQLPQKIVKRQLQ